MADYGGLGIWFWEKRPLVGMIHVKPLPGSPRGGCLDAAGQAVLYRKELGADIAIWADVHVKHASSLGMSSIADDARDAVHRGGADALVISGPATGQPTRATDLAHVRQAVPHARLLVGSGFGPECAGELLTYADGAIVGTGLKRDG